MINGYYKDLDAGYRKPKSPNTISYLKNSKKHVSPMTRKVLLPSTQRLYIEQHSKKAKKRVTVDNFTTSSNQADLWSNPESADLYSTNSNISSGDIIIINVLQDLKSDISKELKRAFKTKKKKTTTSSQQTRKDSNKTITESSSGNPNTQIYDRISSIVIDTVNNSYVSIKGRKELLYKNKKHSIEIQALVNKKDINSNNYLKSSDIIEKTIRVLY
jgi:flagellar basal body L-ring protein FlgH